jgi:hypothetical protein
VARVVRVTIDRRELVGRGAPFGTAGAYERLYPSRDAFLGAVDRAMQALVAERFLLPEDRSPARERMAGSWDWVTTHWAVRGMSLSSRHSLAPLAPAG